MSESRAPQIQIPDGWKWKRLSEIVLTPISGGRPKGGASSESGTIPSIGGEHITKGGSLDFSSAKYIPEDYFEKIKFSKLEPEDILICKDGALAGKVAFYEKNHFHRAAVNEHVFILRPKNENSAKYIFFSLQSEDGQKQIKRILTGSAQPGLTKTFIDYYSLEIPPYIEQRKIAAILSSVDAAIEQTDAIIAQAERMKVGLMQVLLSGNDFTNGTTWQLVDLRTVCNHALNGGTPSTKVNKYWAGDIPWITGADIIDQKIGHIRRYITEEAVKDSSTNIVPKGNLLIVTRTGIGKLAIAPFDVAISQDITGFLPNKLATTKYLYWILNKHKLGFKKFDQGTSINGIKRDDLLSLKIPLPPISKQHEIGTRLCAFNEKLELEFKHRENLNILKNGLMQDLLTGRVRVKVDGHA